MHKHSWSWVLGLAILGFHPATALAGPVEQLMQVLLHPAQPDVIALRYEHGGDGLLISRDGGSSFQLLCSAAANVGRDQLGSALLSGDGALLLGTFRGALGDDGHGCAFARDPALDASWVTDVVADPRDPQVSYAITGRAEPAENGLYRRDAGDGFQPIGRVAPVLLTRLRIAALPDGGLRFYASAVRGTTDAELERGQQSVPNYVLRVSEDGGETWVERPFAPTTGTLRLEAVDPSAPERIVVSVVQAEGEDVLLVSDDVGVSYRQYARVATLSGVVIAADGRVFIGDAGDPIMPGASGGLWRASSLDETPSLLGAAGRISCLGHREADDTLLACQLYSFGSLDPNDGAFAVLLDLRHVADLVSCEDQDVVAACATQLQDAYCSPGHFACAEVCDAYSRDLLAVGECSEGGAGVSAGQGSEPAPDAGSDPSADVEVDGGAGAVSKADHAAPQAEPHMRRSVESCSAAAPGAVVQARAFGSSGGALLVLAALISTRRRRAHAPAGRRRLRRTKEQLPEVMQCKAHALRDDSSTALQRVQRSGEASSPPSGRR